MEQADGKHPINHLGPEKLSRTGGPEPPSFFECRGLRVECFFKTVSGYPNEKGVKSSKMETPGNPLRHDTPRSAPPVFALARSRRPGARHTEGL